jgi:hypothetical protein
MEEWSEREREEGEMGLENLVEVVGGVKRKGGAEVKAKGKAKGKRASFCGCL